MLQSGARSQQLYSQHFAAILTCLLLFTGVTCYARQLPPSTDVSTSFRPYGVSGSVLTSSLSGGRTLLQSSCPASGQAATGCSTVSASQLESYRNILLTQCSSVTPQAAGTSGCCSALPTAGTAAWNTFVDCACSTLANQVGAFVTVSNVISGCSLGTTPSSTTQPSPSSLLGTIGSPLQSASPALGSMSPQAGLVNFQSFQPPTPASVYGLNPTPGSNALSDLQNALGNSPPATQATPTREAPAQDTPASDATAPPAPSTGSYGSNNVPAST